MNMCYRSEIVRPSLFLFLSLALAMLLPLNAAEAGPYLVSAHGDTTNGVSRASMSGYATGNCGHCHEQHGSLEGTKPAPVVASPSPYALFAKNFDDTATANPYIEADNLCFYCHNGAGSVQSVTNKDFSETFGCNATAGSTSILAAFNQTSYHNLNDIYDFATNTDASNPAAPNPAMPFVTTSTNPCNTCHNPHLAKRNWNSPTDPTQTAISKPSDHDNLFGDDTPGERMTNNANYLAPNCTTAPTKEPAAAGSGTGSDMPDYVAFCTTCHNTFNDIETTTIFNMPAPLAQTAASVYDPGGWTPPRNLQQINWTTDKHGSATTSSAVLVAPYTSGNSYLLSCMDCHEAHGSSNIMMIRRRINAAAATNTTGTGVEWNTVCNRCHGNNVAVGASHHVGWLSGFCANCHPAGSYAPCTICHFHNSNFISGSTNMRIF